MGSAHLRSVWTRIDESIARGVLPLVVFDLDSTLFFTAPRNLRITEEFLAAHVERVPMLRRVQEELRLEHVGWNPRDALRKLGVDDEVLLSELWTFWVARFFSDEYVLADTPVPGSVEFVTACHQRGALIYYLTGRHVGGMEIGTVRALTAHDFPYWSGRCVLHLKPSFDMHDHAFKDEALVDIRSYLGSVVATFENEPGNANLFERAFPDALHFLLTTVHSPEAEPPSPTLIRTPDFVLHS